ncbi:uncharacterized protein LOC109538724 [Dendroctonus ponderosae]|nr:uncharacterized protein LOC109538724 [Dendroctonus ponderosae]
MLIIPGGKSKALKLTYFAKKVLNASTILVLSGEVGGQRYAKSQAVSIIGVPQTTCLEEINLTVDTYEYSKRTLNIKTPYGKSYRSKIFLCFKEPKSYNDLHAVKFLKDNYIPREIDFSATECEFAEKGETSLMMSTHFLSQGEIKLYLYFCNDEIGDFCVLITVTSKLGNNLIMDINVELPQNFRKPCICRKGFSFYCPKTFTVHVPSKNTFLMESTERLAENCCAEGTLSLVRRFYGTPVVPRILKFYLERFPQGFLLAACIFDDEIEFSITENKQFSAQQATLTISDVTSDDTVPLVLHWDQDSRPKEAILELNSVNQGEIRRHKLIFPQEEAVNSVSSNIDNLLDNNHKE